MSGVHEVFHVSMLRRYTPDPAHVVDWGEIEIDTDETFEGGTSVHYGRGGNSCQWVVFVSCQYTNRVNIRQPKPDTNNKRVNIR